MKCPYCSYKEDIVVDSRPVENFTVIRRRRQCNNCSKRYTTYEKLDIACPIVIKKDGSKELFDKNKMKIGIITACRKRPVSIDDIDLIINNVEYDLKDLKEIKSNMIGAKILNYLKTIDEVAYVRFMSVYKDFERLETFFSEIKKIRGLKNDNN